MRRGFVALNFKWFDQIYNLVPHQLSMNDELHEVLVLLLIGALTTLLIPTFIKNGGSLYAICSARYIDKQRLFIPTKEAFGHFLQGFIGIALLMLTDQVGFVVPGVILTLIYPIYNLAKRNLAGHGGGLGLNNTSYANNIFDFLVGVWSGYLVSLVTKKFLRETDRTCETCQYFIMAAIVVVILLNIIGALQMKPKMLIENCPSKFYERWNRNTSTTTK